MRLITNKNVSDSLIDYYKDIVYTEYLQQTLLEYKSKLWDNLPLVLKSEDYNRSIDSLGGICYRSRTLLSVECGILPV